MEKDLEKNNSAGVYHYPPIVERYYQFCQWLLPKVSKFQKDQKYILGSRLQNKALDGLEHIVSAAISDKSKKLSLIEHAIMELEHLRFFLRLSVQSMLLSQKSYLYGSELVLNVLKMLAGWKKSIAHA
jgi:hypothetical protein